VGVGVIADFDFEKMAKIWTAKNIDGEKMFRHFHQGENRKIFRRVNG
jgi:hypothetical protein